MLPQENTITEPLISSVERLKAFFELTKPRISALIIIVAMASFFIAERDTHDWWRALLTLAVVASLAGGIFSLNHYLERDRDILMHRTGSRPLPSGKIQPREAVIFGAALATVSLALSVLFVNVTTAAVGLFTAVSYLLVYTPLKRHTAYHTALGALSGATPPLMGWAAARGDIGVDAWILFGVLFFWQFPHFLAIDMIYREDYERAGIRVLPVVDRAGRMVAAEIIGALVLLFAVSLLPPVTGLVSALPTLAIYYAGTAILGLWFLAAGIQAAAQKTKTSARKLLRVSVIYLPLLFILMIACT